VLLANALGTPPPDVIDNVHSKGKLIAALCGSAAQAARHKAAGVDIIIAQGTEGGGHTGEIGSMVLWPEVLDVLGDTPMLAAGGVGSGRQMAAALAMGAQGVWTGSLWLTVAEADVPPAQMQSYFDATSKDTLRSRRGPASPAACSATTGPRPGRRRATPSRSACRCSSWSRTGIAAEAITCSSAIAARSPRR
jgi:NAD(P)H-dependent flavin oxidoreductase YrpB (nitropropane dioxygenase family)